MSKNNNRIRQSFLLTFFDKDEYQEKAVNGYWLIKSINGDSKKWQVAIFTQKSFNNYKLNQKNQRIIN